MQTSLSRWSTVAVIAAIGITSFAGCKSTTYHMSRMPGMGWLAKNKVPDAVDRNGTPIPPAKVALPGGAPNASGVATMAGRGAVPNAGAPIPNFANPAYGAATGPNAVNPALAANPTRPASGYPLNRYSAGVPAGPAASQPWNATPPPATNAAAPQRGLYGADRYAGTPTQPGYAPPRDEADRSRYSPGSRPDPNAGYPRTADLRSRYGATAPATAATGYDQPATTGNAVRDSRFGGSAAPPSADPAGSYQREPQQPYPRTDARADYLPPTETRATATQPVEREATRESNPSGTGWYPGSTSPYEGTPAAGSAGAAGPATSGPVAPASFSNETPGERREYYGGGTQPAAPAAARVPTSYEQQPPEHGTRTY